MNGKHIKSIEERKKIEELIKKENKVSIIAKIIGVSVDTIYYEIARGKVTDDKKSYSALKAQKDYEQKSEKKIKAIKAKNSSINTKELKQLNDDLRMGKLSLKEIVGQVDITQKTVYNNIARGIFPDISKKYYNNNRKS